MNNAPDDETSTVLDWCAEVLGPFTIASDDTREHPGQRASSIRLRSRAGTCFVKMHRDPDHWHSETHAYEQWAPAFGDFAPRLLAVRDAEPLALVISELPGRVLEESNLSPAQERGVWQAAGQRLAALHAHAIGPFFGPCRRDGAPAAAPINDAREYIAHCYSEWLERGARIASLTKDEIAITHAALVLLSAFAGEPALPCHRDYCPANWLVDAGGRWAGVIDFEFSGWDVRAADFTRLPNWEWVTRPDLLEAFFTGYGRSFTQAEEQQRLVAQALYALAAIVWGEENDYHIFAAEGRQALRHVSEGI